jgi:YidC/Oxa1 family membrane protein insertase
MERRVLIAIFLSFVVLYLYQAFLVKPVPKSATAKPAATTTTAPAATAPSQTAQSSAPTKPAAPQAPAAAPLVADANERDVRLETRDVVAVFTNRGARLKSYRLKRYFDQNREPLELVVSIAPTLPFSLRVPDAAVTASLNTALYSVKMPSGASEPPSRVSFEYRDTSGLLATKDFVLDQASYVIDLHVAVSQGAQTIVPAIEWGAALGDSDSQTGRYAVKPRALFSANGKVQRLAASAIVKQPVYDDDFKFAGVDDHYFMAVALSPGRAKVNYQPVSIPPPPGINEPVRDLMAFSIEPPRGEQALKFYAGPKDFDTLAAVDRDLVTAIDFGLFTVIVVPLLRSLKWLNGFIGNYGWSIIALTVIINLIMFPLRHKSVVSMRKMQAIQPEVKAIQDRYAKLKATDPAKQKMNQEMMALYRERGVNPASGCVPMLLTLPVLIAFYSLLSTAIELRGAPFFGWIHDLSQPDPYYITPVLMGVSQLWQQWITPQTGVDPAQQKMMMFMPILFTFFFVTAPSGVALYWLMSNVWGIGQQYLTNYLIGPPVVRTMRPAAERRVKRVGGGKTEAATRES